MSLKQLLVDFLPARVHISVLVALWMLIVVFPFFFMAAQLARVEHHQRYDGAEDWKIMGFSAHVLCQKVAKVA